MEMHARVRAPALWVPRLFCAIAARLFPLVSTVSI
jgi:hypothetical protein